MNRISILWRTLAVGLFLIGTGVAVWASETPGTVSPDQAIESLQDGNARFIAGQATHPRSDANRLTATARNGQQPFATVLSCSDSRVPIETIFDQGVGDVFVVRVAGNVCAIDEIGSIEYAVGHLHTPTVVVLGHTKCGAVTAAATGAEVQGSTATLIERIRPAVDSARKTLPNATEKDLVPAAIKANVWQSIHNLLTTSEEMRELVKSGKVKVVGALYDLESGKVEWLGPHSEQARLLATEPPAQREAAGHKAGQHPNEAIPDADSKDKEPRPSALTGPS
jgi:carbonic anhydrase